MRALILTALGRVATLTPKKEAKLQSGGDERAKPVNTVGSYFSLAGRQRLTKNTTCEINLLI